MLPKTTLTLALCLLHHNLWRAFWPYFDVLTLCPVTRTLDSFVCFLKTLFSKIVTNLDFIKHGKIEKYLSYK